jgi:hypothetical protein
LNIIPIFGESINAYSPVVSRQRRLNCFVDMRKDGDKAQMIIRGTPGAALFVMLPTFPIRGWRNVAGILYVVSGSVLYKVSTSGVYSVLGVLGTFTGLVSLTDNALQLMIVDGSFAYTYTIVTGTYYQSAYNVAGSFGKITADANLPTTATTSTFLNGRVIVNKPNTKQYYVSEQYDVTAWTNVSSLPTFGTKENSSDPLFAVDVLNGAIILWGTQTTEFWQDAGSTPNPFGRVTGATQTWGLAALWSRAFLNNTMIFLGQNPQGSVQVMMLNGYVPQRVSTSDIENLFSGFSTLADAVALTYIVDGHPMYQINFPTAGRSFLYDAISGFWSEVQTGLAVQARHFGNLGVVFNTHNYIADYSSGNIYQLRTDIYTDNGQSIKRQVASRHVSRGGNEFSVSELCLDMETGVGTQGGQGATPSIMLQVSKDYGRTFGPERWISLGPVGQYLTRVVWRRLGAARDFVFQFTVTDPVKFTLVSGAASTWQQEGTSNGG